jgi:hypothetical protein
MMCQFEICACQPVQSGRNGPRVEVVIDRRARPWSGGSRERRVADLPVIEDRRIAGRNQREERVAAGVWGVVPGAGLTSSAAESPD